MTDTTFNAPLIEEYLQHLSQCFSKFRATYGQSQSAYLLPENTNLVVSMSLTRPVDYPAFMYDARQPDNGSVVFLTREQALEQMPRVLEGIYGPDGLELILRCIDSHLGQQFRYARHCHHPALLITSRKTAVVLLETEREVNPFETDEH